MKFLIVGLGSMGKRRIRNLQALGHVELAGFDIRKDRRDESKEKYDIEVYSDFNVALNEFCPDVFIISTPPEFHMKYAFIGLEKKVPCFIEASVVEADKILELHNIVKDTTLLMAPSCSMKYNAGPMKVKELVCSEVIGKVLNINYQTGQYLPDWHPWEKIENFYVSSRETGGCREIVPFELTWLSGVFGQPEALACSKAKLTNMNANIDDIYHCLLRFPEGVLANITVEVISRPKATRELRILGTEGEIVFSADENCVRYINTESDEWIRFEFDTGTVEKDYINPEEPYIAEIKDFVNAIIQGDKNLYPNTLLNDYYLLQTLYRLEELSETIQ
jgi:predicted dehydrogenase